MNNDQDEYYSSISNTINALKDWSQIVWIVRENEFIDTFCPHAWVLNHVSWNEECMKIVFILKDGQHVANSFPISKWLEFYQKESL